ncbi:MAG: NAD-dependent epimerase/dehydratase family protein [Gammaproteobacteria bacterium]|nr:NAD-dependent epimerase/dehydratase family protein [Gammaproteobacteria bacterium]
MTTLVTGATGFVGSAVARALVDAGKHVRVLVRPTSDRRNLLGLPIDVVEGDLGDRSSLERALVGCKALFHVAADYRLWSIRPEELYEANVAGTSNIMLAAACAGVKRIVYTSSVAALGLNPDGSPANETTPVTVNDMIGHYKRSKFLAEAEVRRLVDREGLPAIIVNPSAPIGPRDIKPTPTGRMILDALLDRMPAYVDTGLNLVHVDDVAMGHLLAFQHGRIGERYILGGQNMTLKEILHEVASLTGHAPPRIRLPHAVVFLIAYFSETWARLTSSGEPRVTIDGARMSKKRMFFSSEKAQRELGYQPRPIREALVDAMTWFRENGFL